MTAPKTEQNALNLTDHHPMRDKGFIVANRLEIPNVANILRGIQSRNNLVIADHYLMVSHRRQTACSTAINATRWDEPKGGIRHTANGRVEFQRSVIPMFHKNIPCYYLLLPAALTYRIIYSSGCLVKRRYGFTARKPGNNSLALSSLIEVWIITSSFGYELVHT